MTPEQLMDPRQVKEAIRKQAHDNRRAQENKEELQRWILRQFAALSEYQAAQTVMFYIDVRTEVRTCGETCRKPWPTANGSWCPTASTANWALPSREHG